MRFVVDDNDKIPLLSEVRAGLEIPPANFGRLKASFKRVIHDFEETLIRNGGTWYSDQWIEQNLSNIAATLDRSLDRWRHLYRSARGILTRATQKIEPGLLTPGTDEYRKYDRQQKQASPSAGAPPQRSDKINRAVRILSLSLSCLRGILAGL